MENILADHQRLKEENAALRRLLIENGIALPAEPRNDSPTPGKPRPQTAGVDEHSDKDAKIALFRELFRGRQDVYAVRTRFKSGDWGYVPASIRDWKAVLSADAALRKKVDQKTRKLLPITDDVVRQHLEGKQTIGVYPLLLDETCWFLAVDFDKKCWQDDAAAFLETCRDLGDRQHLNDHARAMAAMSGFSSSGRFLRQRRESSEVSSSPEPWIDATNLEWIPTTASSPIRTRCQRAASGISSLYPCNGCRDRATTACSSIRISARIPINGSSSQASEDGAGLL